MAIERGIFGNDTNFEDRFIQDHKNLVKLVEHWKGIGLKIVLTSGTYDMFHIGHAKYLEKAKQLGDILVVGVDSDEKVRARKGPNRPVVPEDERLHILSHVRHVDVLVLKNHTDPKHNLIKLIRPDVLIVSETTGHKKNDLNVMKKFCGRIEILESQSQASTTAKIRRLHVDGMKSAIENITGEITAVLKKAFDDIQKGGE